MKKTFIPIAFILISFALLVWQRFDLGPRTDVVVLASKNSTYQLGDRIKRGQIIETQAGEYLVLGMDEARIGISERTTLELSQDFADRRLWKFPRGRILVHNPTKSPIFIDTFKTQNNVTDATATLVNFDFLQTVHLIPLYHSIETSFRESNESLILPVALAVHETQPITYEPISFDVFNNTASDFYTWFDKTAFSP